MTWLDALTLETVVLHMTHNGPSLKGLKVAVHDDCIVLRDVIALGETSNDVLNGQIAVPKERVLFIQIVDGGIE
ncbi:MAG: hypothetical protein JWM31_1273 [Solirubrobacterales bacterium]|nr:hypothetical protein [Solirubrobacterales bacterium]